MNSPFTFGKIATLATFTNREKEQARIMQNAQSGINTILISPRRWGKSSLVAQAAQSLMRKNKKVKFCFIDLFNVRSEEFFYQRLARSVIRGSSTKWEDRMGVVKTFFRHIVPKISFSPEPSTDIGISFNWEELKQHPDEVLDLAERVAKAKGIRLVVCVDEFQNIAYFDDPLAFQKQLRSHWQQHQHVTYFIYGSKRKMLSELFEKQKNPFYKFGDVIMLNKIERKHWQNFIPERFASTRKKISEALAGKIADLMENHPYFVQQLANECWQRTSRYCTEEIVDEALGDLLTQMTILYQKEVDLLTTHQINFLKAVCDGVEKFSSVETLRKYELGASSNIKRVREALEEKEVLDLMGQKAEFVDPLFSHWFRIVFMNANAG